MLKQCSWCHQFHEEATVLCKACKAKKREGDKEYNKKNKSKRQLWNKNYRQRHKERLKEYHRNYREQHKEQMIQASRDYRKKHPDRIKRSRKARNDKAEARAALLGIPSWKYIRWKGKFDRLQRIKELYDRWERQHGQGQQT